MMSPHVCSLFLALFVLCQPGDGVPWFGKSVKALFSMARALQEIGEWPLRSGMWRRKRTAGSSASTFLGGIANYETTTFLWR